MSSVTLLNVVRGAKIVDRERSLDRYIQLLQDGGVEHAGELVELSEKLGKTVDQISADSLMLERFAEAEKLLKSGIENDVREKAAKAQTDLQHYTQETKGIIAERERVTTELDYVEMDATHALSTTVGAEELLIQLKRQRPDLLGNRTIPHI